MIPPSRDDLFRDGPTMDSRSYTPVYSMANNDSPFMDIDLSEGDDAYALKAEITGAEKEDIEVELARDMVTIRATSTWRQDSAHACLQDFYRDEVQYAVSLPSSIDKTRCTARFENGVLTLSLPKQA